MALSRSCILLVNTAVPGSTRTRHLSLRAKLVQRARGPDEPLVKAITYPAAAGSNRRLHCAREIDAPLLKVSEVVGGSVKLSTERIVFATSLARLRGSAAKMSVARRYAGRTAVGDLIHNMTPIASASILRTA